MEKKIIALVAVFSMTLSAFPITTFAQEFRSANGIKTDTRVRQYRKVQGDGSVGREELQKKNKLERAELKSLSIDAIRDKLQGGIVFQKGKEEKKADEDEGNEEVFELPLPIDDDEEKIAIPEEFPLNKIHIIDNGDKGFWEKGSWERFSLAGYEYDFHYIAGTNPIMALFFKAKAVWQKESLKKGNWDVYATWDVFDHLAPEVTYKIKSDSEVLSKVKVDQTKEPNDITAENRGWKKLDTVKIGKKDDITVVLNNTANGFVIADAIMIARAGDTPPPPPSSMPEFASVTNANPDADGSAVPTGVSNIGQFRFTAKDSNESGINLKSIIFTVEADNVEMANEFVVYNKSDQLSTKTCSVYDNAGNTIDDAQFTVNGKVFAECLGIENLVELGAGETADLVLETSITNPLINGANFSSVQVVMQNFAVDVKDATEFGPTGDKSHVVWNENGNEHLWMNLDTTRVESTFYGDEGGSTGAATLTIAQKETGTTNTTVENAQDVVLLRFEARASEEDILLTKAVFEAAGGNLENAQNYTLWVDTDGDSQIDTILEEGVATQSHTITFADLAGGGFIMPMEGTTIVFEVHADIASSLLSDGLQLQFQRNNPRYIEAERLDNGDDITGIQTNGACAVNVASCNIVVSTVDAILWYLSAQGNLFVTQDSTPVRIRQHLGGKLGDTSLRLALRAETEAIDVTDLQIVVDGHMHSIDRLELYLDGETEPFAIATRAGCANDPVPVANQTMCANMENRQLVVPAGEVRDIIVRPRIKSDTAGGLSGDHFTLLIDELAHSVRARGDVSSNDLASNDGNSDANGEVFIGTDIPAANSDITGNINDTTMSKIVSISNANPDAHGTSVPTGISQVGQFKLTAAAHSNSKDGLNDVQIEGLIFNVTAYNVAVEGSSFRMYNKADSTTGVTCVPHNPETGDQLSGTVTGTLTVLCDGLENSPVDTEIDEGHDSIFVLEMNITNPNTAAATGGIATLQVSLQNFDGYTGDTDSFGPKNSDTHVRWFDTDASTHTEFTWIEYVESSVKSTAYVD